MSHHLTSRCSIVIRSYNEERHIGKLLHGIMQQTWKNVETIIVDSGSSDATTMIANRFPTTIISIDPKDFSFGSSLNVGCQAATGEFIVVASAHVYPICRDWLERLLAPFADPKVALVYGKQRGNDATNYSEHQIFKKWFPSEPNPDQGHPFCNNANAAILRSVWQSLPYDESLTGIEDLDWAKRAMELGYKLVYQPGAEVVHVHKEKPSQTYNRYQREAIALKYIFPREHFHFGDFLCLFFTNLFADFLDASKEGVLREHLREIFTFRLMQFWGTYRGFSQRGPISNHLKRTFYYPNQDGNKPRMPAALQENRPLVDYESGVRAYRDNH